MTLIDEGTIKGFCKNSSDVFCRLFPQLPKQSCVLKRYNTDSVPITDIGTLVVSSFSILIIVLIAVRSFRKKAAVGRKEIFLSLISMIPSIALTLTIDSFTFNSNITRWLSIAAVATRVMFTWALLYFGFVGFQMIPDGSSLSIFLMILSMVLFTVSSGLLSFLVSRPSLVSRGEYGNNDAELVSLFVFGVILPYAFVILYTLTQAIIVFKYLAVRKPLLWLVIIILSSAGILVCNNFISQTICRGTSGSIDGSMFYLCFQLLAAFSVYQFWNSITEDETDDFAGMYKF
ncbi:hypothetical protein BB560_001118 [Smittium megazygosporum]|uniref:Uncharacterized protein n=1 Tax=Smittium megazygosporum TaxID=133381 RepID=A0A2T9ZIH5_9FUNG|nr:hypothetical protein BB560_001117 [Smittium megazygosporum]PVV04392.1 hypothetical protein BB560_001118 [Smittium megazygosporum]